MAINKKQQNISSPSKSKTPRSTASDSTRYSLFKIFDKKYEWEDQDEVLDAVYWYRQVLAFIMGIIWGFARFTGSYAIISFGIINSLAAYAIANRTGYEFESDDTFLSVKEGMMATFATFLVSWIVTYTAVNFS